MRRDVFEQGIGPENVGPNSPCELNWKRENKLSVVLLLFLLLFIIIIIIMLGCSILINLSLL